MHTINTLEYQIIGGCNNWGGMKKFWKVNNRGVGIKGGWKMGGIENKKHRLKE